MGYYDGAGAVFASTLSDFCGVKTFVFSLLITTDQLPECTEPTGTQASGSHMGEQWPVLYFLQKMYVCCCCMLV